MAGHSKWAQIKHKKASADAKKGQLFAKLARFITVAAREKGGDPNTNPSLREAIEKARAVNMPKENIERAAQKGLGGGDEKLETFLYEAYGPGGVAMLISVITDNNNRTSNEVKHLLALYGGKWVSPGSVSWAFTKTEGGWDPMAYTQIHISNEDKEKLEILVSKLDDYDDVQDIYTNESDS